ncbi:DUF2188 domain-containing protein [Mesorhizobium huakuii]|uniref:DUF2188 domain-containing protein n=1 Tax=Mesorhizobium huakuii TaxID=28104 RepID=A0A7G6SS88_9HYPH|nr:DUF2188 domain-containing protein [Mesorhizobium huakuii]QND57370.1 DUF2188 domain-containing protein [Mesorhizobium huakuii]
MSKDADRWKIRYEDKEYPYDTHTAALIAAIKAAKGAVSHGYAAEVLVQGIDGKWRTEWSDGDQR